MSKALKNGAPTVPVLGPPPQITVGVTQDEDGAPYVTLIHPLLPVPLRLPPLDACWVGAALGMNGANLLKQIAAIQAETASGLVLPKG